MFNSIFFYEYGYNVIFEPEYIAVLNYAIANNITIPKRDQNVKNNKKIKKLKQLGAFTELDLFYYFKQEAGLADFARINWVNPNQFYLTQSNSLLVPVFEARKGFKGNFADGKFFNTQYTPSIHAVKATLNNTSVFYKSYEEVLGVVMGTRNGASNNFVIRQANANGGNVNQFSANTGDPSIGQFALNSHVLNAKPSNTHNYYVNGVLSQTVTYASTTLSTHPMSIFGWNLAGTTAQFFTGGIEYIGLGSGFFNTIPLELFETMNE
jgi:hypothetical protein